MGTRPDKSTEANDRSGRPPANGHAPAPGASVGSSRAAARARTLAVDLTGRHDGSVVALPGAGADPAGDTDRAPHRNGHGPLVTGAAPRATNGGDKARRAAAKRAEAEAKARRKADRKAEAKADRKAQRKAETAEKAEKIKAQADGKAQRKADRKAEAKADLKAQADGKAQRKAEKKAKAKADRKAQRKAEKKAKATADRKAQRKADQKKAKATARGKADRMADDQAPRMEQNVEATAPHAGDRADVDPSAVGAEPSAGADGDALTPPPDVPDAETLPDGTDAAAAAPADDDPSRALPDLPAVPAAAGRPDAVQAYPADELANDLLLARISRAIDDREIALQKQSRVFFQISGAGHEALLLGLAHELRAGYDWFFPYYRDLALMLGLGMSAEQILLQAVGSADDPASGGRQMPAHWGDHERNVVTQSSPTGSQCIPAVGCAEAGRYIVRRPDLGLPAHGDEVTYVSLGEGATSEGEFWESLNTACTEHLPVLFVVADNGYAISVPSSEQSPAPIHDLVKGFAGLQVWTIDGTDYFEVRRAAEAVVSHVRAGVGPALIHATVTRPYSHSAADTQSKYRLPHELAWEAENDPIERLEAALVDGGVISADQAAHLRDEARRIVADAAKAALARPRPDPACVLDHVVALPDIPDPGEVATGTEGDDVVAMGEAIRRTLHEVMDADERIRVFGEDVADAREAVLADVEGKGGVFGTTHGLQRDFGRARCYNTPLAEANIIGRAVGQAIRGLRPAPEIQFFDYIWPAMQQIRSEAATIRWRSNGAFTCPTVMRVPIGGYLQGGSIWHSQSGESIFAHIPGLLVAFPSRASDAAGLLRAAFRCEDPVLFLEHKHLLRQPYTRDPFPDDGFVVPFGKGRYVTRGTDLTIVTWGATVERSRLAAEQLAETDGASVEIVDLRTLVPWDQELVAESVAKTSRLLVVHEDVVRAGFGGEIAAWVAEQSFWQLDAPIGRVGAQECHVAYAPELENAILPQVDDIATAAHRLLCA